MAKTILLIEAEDEFAGQLTAEIEARGGVVERTSDGKEGLKVAENGVDAIVLCVELPKMSGYAVCNKLKKNKTLKEIPLIITSSEATPKTFDQHRKLKTRAEEYVIKPCEASEVVDKIHGLIGLEAAEELVNADEDLDLLDEALDSLEIEDEDLDDIGDGTQIINTAEIVEEQDEDDLLDALEIQDDDSADLAIDALGGGDVEELDESLDFKEADEADLAIDALGADDSADLAIDALGGDSAEVAIDALGGDSAEVAIDALGGDDIEIEAELEVLEDAALDSLEAEPPPPPVASGSAGAAHRTAALETELDKLRATRSDLEAKLSEAQDELRAKTNELDAFQKGGSGGGSPKDVLKLKGELTKRDKEILALKEELNGKEKAALEWQETENELELKAAEFEEDVVKKDAQIKTLHEKVDAQNERVDGLQVELEEAQDLARRSGELQADLEAVTEERNALQSQVSELGLRIADTTSTLSKAERDRDQAQGGLETATTELEDLREQVQSLESENSKNEDRVLKAYQKLKSDEKIRDKTRKALTVALQLLDEAPEDDDVDEVVDDLDLDEIQIDA